MGSSDRLFNRQRTLHEILGGGQGMKFSFLISFFYSMSLLLICVDQCYFNTQSLVLFVYVHFGTIWFNSGIDLCLFAFGSNGKRVRTRRTIDHDLWIFAESMPCLVQCSCRFNTVETEEPNDGDIVGDTSCLDCVWKIWLYSSVSCFQCFPSPHCHSFPLGQVSCDSQQVTVPQIIFLNVLHLDLLVCAFLNSEMS